MRIVSAHQPAYFPWLGYFHKLMVSDVFVIMDDVQYEKNSFINRNKILQRGDSVWLSVPVITKNHKKKTIRDMKVENRRWKRKHLMTVQQTYKKAPFFDEVMPIIESALSVDSDFLIDHTNHQLKTLLAYLGIETQIKFASELNICESKLDYVIELTQKTNGDIFVFGAQGKDYADTQVLSGVGIRPHFQDYRHPAYEQCNQVFVPYMSVIDGMFCAGRALKELIMKNNVTKQQLRYE